MKALNVNKLTKAGCIFKFWVADWFAQLNNKMGGDLKKIQTVGRYMIEVWKAVGMDLSRVQFLWSSEEINGKAGEYWPLVMDIARKNKLPRIIRLTFNEILKFLMFLEFCEVTMSFPFPQMLSNYGEK